MNSNIKLTPKKRAFITGTILLAFLICQHAEFLATYILMEPRCASFLPLMGISVPFAALHACINGYYYGTQKANVPAFSQVVEQIIRMVCVFLLANTWMAAGNEITVHLAVIGHLIGETASAIFTVFCLCFFPPQVRIHSKMPADRHSFNERFIAVASPLMMCLITFLSIITVFSSLLYSMICFLSICYQLLLIP